MGTSARRTPGRRSRARAVHLVLASGLHQSPAFPATAVVAHPGGGTGRTRLVHGEQWPGRADQRESVPPGGSPVAGTADLRHRGVDRGLVRPGRRKGSGARGCASDHHRADGRRGRDDDVGWFRGGTGRWKDLQRVPADGWSGDPGGLWWRWGDPELVREPHRRAVQSSRHGDAAGRRDLDDVAVVRATLGSEPASLDATGRHRRAPAVQSRYHDPAARDSGISRCGTPVRRGRPPECPAPGRC